MINVRTVCELSRFVNCEGFRLQVMIGNQLFFLLDLGKILGALTLSVRESWCGFTFYLCLNATQTGFKTNLWD